MKRWSLVCLAAVIAASCCAACTAENGSSSAESSAASQSAASESSEAASEASKAASGTTSEASETASEAESEAEASESKKTAHEIDSMENGQKVAVKESEIYRYLCPEDQSDKTIYVETTIYNEDSSMGKKDQSEKVYYDFGNSQTGQEFYSGDTMTGIYFCDYANGKNYMFNAEYNKYYKTNNDETEMPEYGSKYLAGIDGEFEVKDGRYIYAVSSDAGTYEISYGWDDATGGVHVVSETGGVVNIDATIVLDFEENVEGKTLADTMLAFTETAVEVEPLDLSKMTTMYDYIDLFSGDSFWENAKPIE